MRGDAVAGRLLLIYEEEARRLEAAKDFAPDVLRSAARLVRRFVEDYHETVEEKFVFPRFEKSAKPLTELVAALRQHHQAGRLLTDDIQRLSASETLATAEGQARLAKSLRLFVRMYRPHALREETVLLPALHDVLDEKANAELAETVEHEEQTLLGERGASAVVDEVARLEREVGIHDLAKLLPR